MEGRPSDIVGVSRFDNIPKHILFMLRCTQVRARRFLGCLKVHGFLKFIQLFGYGI